MKFPKKGQHENHALSLCLLKAELFCYTTDIVGCHCGLNESHNATKTWMMNHWLLRFRLALVITGFVYINIYSNLIIVTLKITYRSRIDELCKNVEPQGCLNQFLLVNTFWYESGTKEQKGLPSLQRHDIYKQVADINDLFNLHSW